MNRLVLESKSVLRRPIRFDDAGHAAVVIAACVLVGMVLVTVGCNTNSRKAAVKSDDHPAPVTPGVIVEPRWLADHIKAGQVQIIDARPSEEYAAGHLPGAVNLPPERLLHPDAEHNRDIAPIPLIQQVFGECGITMERPVVVYDGEYYRAAARVFWALELHGHPAAAVLNGGYRGWIASGGAVTTQVTPIRPTVFIANIQPERLATKLTVLRAIQDNSTAILDSRSDEEYQGLVSKADRKGHIASAINIDFKQNLELSESGVCSLRFSNELIDLYRRKLQGRTKAISYCNSGNRASVSYLALRAAGIDAAVYDGSWLEWGNDPELPISEATTRASDD